MSDDRKDLPAVNSSNYLERVRETLSTYLGLRGDLLDRGLTVRDLLTPGLIELSKTYTATGRGSPIVGTGSALSYEAIYVPNLIPPPMPSGFVVSAAITSLFLGHDAPLYTQGHGHAKTVVYGATRASGAAAPTFSDAVIITEFTGTVFAYATNPATTWHLWIKWVTVDGVASASPAGGTNGLVVTTGQDVALLLTALNGQIKESELFASLGARIDLVDGASVLAGSVNARVLAEATARAAAVLSEATTRANAILDEAAARGTAITTEATARSNADGALSTRVDTVTATATTDRGAATSAIQAEATTRANADSAESSARTTLASALRTEIGQGDTAAQNTAQAYVDTNFYTKTNRDSAVAAQNSTLRSEFATADATTLSSSQAYVQGYAYTKAQADLAAAGQVAVVAARLNTGDFAAVKTESSASASAVTGLSAQYTVKVQTGTNYVTGFGLASSVINGTPTSEFIIRADNFAIAPVNTDNTAADDSPFFYRTAATTINGVSVPAGAYMKAAFIHDATITNAKIANLAVDNAKIADLSVSKLTAGSIAVGQYAQSTSYVASSAGWRINGNGTAEFSDVVVRGTVFASAGAIGGNTIDATGLQSPGYVAASTGWRLDTSGLLRAFAAGGTRVIDMAATGTGTVLKIGSSLEIKSNGDATFSGTLSATSGVFSGSLSGADITGASGTFSGLLTADTLGSVAVAPIAISTTGSWQTVTVPANCNAVKLTLTGGGGGGGGAYWYDTPRGYGGPGGGGALLVQTVTGLTAGQTLQVLIGLGGTGGNTAVYAAPYLYWNGGTEVGATAGGSTVVSGYASAAGGAGGGFNAATYDEGTGYDYAGRRAAGASGGLGYGRGGNGYYWQTGYWGWGDVGVSGRAIFEFYNASSVVTQTEFRAFKAQLGY